MGDSDAATLKIEHVRTEGGVLIRLTGTIDETFDAARFGERVSGVVVIDLDGVNRITSYGVREWMRAIMSLNCTWLGVARCRPAIVTQLNTVDKFVGPGVVLSLYLPYLCPTSGKTFELLVDVRQQHQAICAFNPPPARCPDSGTPAELDDQPDSYLAYVAAQPLPEPPHLADQLLTGQAPVEGSWGGLRLSKYVFGGATGLWLLGRLDEKASFRRISDGIEGVLYVSCGSVTSINEGGIGRFLTLLREVKASIVLDEMPLSIVERIAIDPGLSPLVTLHRINLPYACATHGSFVRAVEAPRLHEFAKDPPRRVSCEVCGESATPQFVGSAVMTATALHAAVAGEEVSGLIHAYRVHRVDNTPSRPKRSTGAFAVPGLVLGRYQLLRPLGAGGMAEVFLARQTGLGGFDREVVIKRILPGLALDTSFVDMFLQEARLAARLSHPNVVQIFDVGKEMDQYFIVMEFVRGRDLNALLKASLRQKVPCPPATAAHIAADIARGLSAAHSYTDAAGKPQPIVHRDVSPHNVLISFHGHVKITDFGIAKAHDSSNVTPTSLLKGKVSYMAPEQLVNARQPPDPRSDIFALGLVLYQLLTLVHPYKKDSEVATFRSLMEEAPHAPSTIVPGLSPEIDRICNHALAKNPAARYQTAKELEEDLEKFIVSRGTAVSAFDVAQWLGSLPEMGPREAELPGVAAPAREGTAQTKVSKS